MFLSVSSYLLLSVSLLFFLLSGILLNSGYEYFLEFNALSLNSASFSFIMLFDWLSFLFGSYVLFISSMILKYTKEYMLGDSHLNRFIFLMLLFIFSMLMMIFSPNLVSILLGWDGLGLVSYALVIYYQNIKSFNAGMLTALSNRIGDAALLMGIAWMMSLGGWNLFTLKFYTESSLVMFIYCFIILAAITKSAQIPFSSWLPAAMAAPTPVSALVHSSTLVTAGVYLLIRSSEGFSSMMMMILLYGALLTMFMAGVGANLEFDLKKIIALSTLSQLGMMITILCLGGSKLAFFHLLIHALFKALLFMCAGAIIHNLNSTQDIRSMGGVSYFMPLTCVCMNISNFALCGIPFLSGFYSKDLIAEFLSMEMPGIFIYTLFFMSIGLTVSYSMRLSYYLFWSDLNFTSLMSFSDNNTKIMLKGMMGLVLLVVIKGSILSWILFETPYFLILPSLMKLLTILMIFLGSILGYEFSQMKFYYQSKVMRHISGSSFCANMWNLPILSTYGLNHYFLILSKSYFKTLDSGWLEYYGSKHMFYNLKFFSQLAQIFSKNHLKIFLSVCLIFIILLVLFF
uniref:NADH-ubiquinone oxidoreductase chain 5 n=1 Tax=Anthonomus rectirostris TaxID=1341944 RepID=A0A5B9XWU2_9CUCU|nr:NADH dehydrogenase subunit 5 [Anthonomus rectirostris]QEH58479.1 NADH dehydrogenase subunit 5 [Anthonomus rectirostris]